MSGTVEKVIEILSNYNLNQYEEIDKNKIVFDNEVRKMCEANSCGRYKKTWMCPPGVGDIWDWKKRITEKNHTVLFNYVRNLEDSFDFEGMQEAAVEFKKIVSGINEAMSESGEDYLLFGAGGCSVCQKCTYPDEVCRFPKKAIPSIESCGVFVSKTAVPCGFKYINGTNTITYFGLLAL